MSYGRVGQRVGDWRLERVLGEGLGSTLYAGCHEPTGTRGAVRVFDPEIARGGWERLERAVAALFRAGLAHPAGSQVHHAQVVHVLDMGVQPMGAERVHYLVEELVEGITVRRALAGGPLPHDQTTRILDQILLALLACRSATKGPFVHGDLRAENIFVISRPDGSMEVKIGDLPSARAIPGEPIRNEVFLGVPEHMAPEQIRGEAISDRTDLWAVGILAFELSTGRRPFEGKSALATLQGVLNDPLPALPATVPPRLAEFVRRCLDATPGARPDAASLRALLT